MSIKSTHFVTRDFALEVIKKKLEECNDEQLSDILEEVIHNGFYNFRIVSNKQLEEEKRNHGFVLDDINNLPEYNNAY